MKQRFYLLAIVIFFLIGCSLDYGQLKEDDSWAPEFIFNAVHMIKIKSGKKDSEIQAVQMEQYRDMDAVFAKGVRFTVYNDEGKIAVEGTCGLLSADNDNDMYILSEQVRVRSYEQDLQIESTTLRWNNQTEQLTNAKDEAITIIAGLKNQDPAYAHPEKESDTVLTMTGYGLAASGVSKAYTVYNRIEGTIITGKSE